MGSDQSSIYSLLCSPGRDLQNTGSIIFLSHSVYAPIRLQYDVFKQIFSDPVHLALVFILEYSNTRNFLIFSVQTRQVTIELSF